MEKKTLMQAIASNKADIISTLGLTVKKQYSNNKLLPGVVVKTNIPKSEYFNVRLEITTGMGHNTKQNNVLSLNVPFFSTKFFTPNISRETYDADIISSVTTYIDTDGTVSFYLKSRAENFPAYTIFELVVIGCTAMTTNPENRITSISGTNDAYQAHEIEVTAELV